MHHQRAASKAASWNSEGMGGEREKGTQRRVEHQLGIRNGRGGMTYSNETSGREMILCGITDFRTVAG